MKVKFDNSLKIAGIGIAPWPRLGPERWFKNYKIFSYHGWDLECDTVSVHALADRVRPLPSLKRLNSQHLLENPDFQDMLKTHADRYNLLTYKPVSLPAGLSSYTILENSPHITAKYENKAWFREQNADLPFPKFVIHLRDELRLNKDSYNRIMGRRSKVVLQDEQLSGGKGTHIVENFEQYKKALRNLRRMSVGKKVIVSEFIESGVERSMQACVTTKGIVSGPLQKQIVADYQLSNLRVADGDKFCGIELTKDNPELKHEIEKIAQAVGARLQAEGYKGIFGIDCIVQDGKVYLLEVNPRLTGATPLLTMLYREGRDIPFYLLHILELGKIQYEIEESIPVDMQTGALVLLHGQNDKLSLVEDVPTSGLYTVSRSGTVRFHKKAISFVGYEDREDLILIQEHTPRGHHVKPGGRIVNVYFPYAILDSDDCIRQDVRQIISNIYSMVNLQESSK